MELTNEEKEQIRQDEIRADGMDGYEETEELCPKCESGYLIKHMEANGPDDYNTVWSCEKCGSDFSN